MNAVDLGCGGGNVTLEIAAVGCSSPGDRNRIWTNVKLLWRARRRNSRFGQTSDSRPWIYAIGTNLLLTMSSTTRFVLQHLAQPLEMLGRMWEAGTLRWSPDSGGRARFRWLGVPSEQNRIRLSSLGRTRRVIRRRGWATMQSGAKLYSYFLESRHRQAPKSRSSSPVEIEG